MKDLHLENTNRNRYGEWIVALAVMFATTSQIMISAFEMFSPLLSSILGFSRNIVLFLLLAFQVKHYGIHIKGKHGFFFFILYSIYILLYITIFRVYKMEDIVAGPSSVFHFFFRTIQLLVYFLCAESIIRHLNCEKFLFVSFFTAIMPALFLIHYVGFETIQYFGSGSNDDFSFLTLGYCNSPLFILGVLLFIKTFKRNLLYGLFAIIVSLAVAFILFAGTERGPIIWCVANLVICLFLFVKNKIKYIIVILIFGLIGYLNIDNIIDSIKGFAPRTAERIESTVKEGNTNGRFDLDRPESSTYIIAWNQFLASPIYGSYFRLITNHIVFRGHYPHNIFMEIMITMGIVGLIPFLLLLLRAWSVVRKTFKYRIYTEGQIICLILFLSEFLKLQTSKTVVFNAAFWTFFYIMCNFDMIVKSRKATIG